MRAGVDLLLYAISKQKPNPPDQPQDRYQHEGGDRRLGYAPQNHSPTVLSTISQNQGANCACVLFCELGPGFASSLRICVGHDHDGVTSGYDPTVGLTGQDLHVFGGNATAACDGYH